tara:strand:+ start:788 stop:2215 length:1428 start_codon:yes stop_codon:yes gene_type:complete
MKKKQFTLENQLRFAKLSGDYNPIHIDKIAARRMIFGMPIVHGIHPLLWALDIWLQNANEKISISSIKVFFEKPIGLDEEISLSINNDDQRRVRMTLLGSNLQVKSTIIFTWERSKIEHLSIPFNSFPDKSSSCAVSDQEIMGKSGELDLYLNVQVAKEIFPNLLNRVSPLQVAVLLGISRLVGVECPGLHSLFSELSLECCMEDRDCKTLKYEVKQFKRKMSLAFISVTSPIMNGNIRAFLRPKTQKQDSYKKIQKLVDGTEFIGWCVIVIGGSRGLGEVCAKILAAGGAKVIITYRYGLEDANEIVEEINTNSGTAKCMYYDVLAMKQKAFDSSQINWHPTHLFYFATPYISSGKTGGFSTSVFNNFCNYYVVGFMKCTNLFLKSGLRYVFYPSSIFIDDVPMNMGEYTSSKIAGEMLCQYLEKNNGGLKIYKPRLPRMSTDQTVSLLPLNNEDPVSVMLHHLKKFKNIIINN